MRIRKRSCQPLIPLWLAAVLFCTLGAMPRASAQAPWAMTGCSATHGGQSTAVGALMPAVYWSYVMDANDFTATLAPVVAADGTVYCANGSNSAPGLVALTAAGVVKWNAAFPTTSTYQSCTSAALGPDGTIYAAYDRLYAISPTGAGLWAFSAPNGVSTPVVGTQAIYFASGGTLVAVNPNGTKRWSNAVGTAITTPALGINGLIAVGCGKKLIALDTTGTIRGTYTAPAAVGQPVIGKDGTIYFAANTTLYAVSATGSLKWSKCLGAAIATPAVSAAGVIYCGVGTNSVMALSSTGTVKWTVRTVSALNFTTPAIGADGVVYIVANAGFAHLYALCPAGSILWDYVSNYDEGEFYNAPVIGTQNTVYLRSSTALGSFNGIVAFRTPPTTVAQPDLGLYNADTSTYIGNNIYNTTGVGQCCTITGTAGITRTYRIPLQNDSAIATNFRLQATAGANGWTVRYYWLKDPLMPIDITAEITTIGWTTAPLASGTTFEIYADITPTSCPSTAATFTAKVGASSYGASPRYDLVSITTAAPTPRYQPDVILSASPTSTAYCGANVYNTTGSGQTMTASVTAGGEKWYFIRIQNDGTLPTRYYVGTPASATSTVAFTFINAAGQNLTATLCTSPYYLTPLVAPGAETQLTVIIRTCASAAAGQSLSVPICVWSAADPTARDCAVAATVVGGTSCTTVGLD